MRFQSGRCLRRRSSPSVSDGAFEVIRLSKSGGRFLEPAINHDDPSDSAVSRRHRPNRWTRLGHGASSVISKTR